jgi:hypothetical protein
VSLGPVLEYCDKMKKLPTPSKGFDFPKQASLSWNIMKNPENVLAQWKKKSK